MNESPGLPILIDFKSFLTCARSAALNIPDLSGNALLEPFRDFVRNVAL